ncbi:predicted protein [Streptomyces iranensis]|uniref:Uncharacterized protein n=1 Tax=Streptomyces iranensis TaxID=576784 RepID=A0A060ZJC6_9ACTN|nr:predicted protein [Streptomyces iranensis]
MVFTMAVTRLVLQRSCLLVEATDSGVGAVVPTLPQLETSAAEGARVVPPAP